MINIMPSMNNNNKNITFENSPKNTAEVPKGYLVHENPIQAVGGTVKGYADNVKYMVNAVNGKGDDYSVGKINDLTIRAGSLGIAFVLASLTRNPAVKTMEFAGFASFFAAMSIWPKLFIGTPLKAKTGFDVNQQYVDSYGRRKRFFEDPQYLPWDLYSNDEINKIGDKLKIPRNIENREKHIKAKMQQISTQANTLWMLTAGLSTPLMASLMGNYISKYVNNVVEMSRAKSSIKSTDMADFTGKSQNAFQKIFVNPLANLISLTSKKKSSESLEDTLKTLDDAYDTIFGKSDDTEYEYNKARLLYENVSDNKMLTQYDSNRGTIIVKDANGNITRTIKTKNTDGISIFGNKWKQIPNRLVESLGITPKRYKELMEQTVKVNKNGATPEESEILADMLIKEFGGLENKDKLQKALKQMAKILMPSIEELDDAKSAFEGKLASIEAGYKTLLEDKNITDAEKIAIEEKIKYIVEQQQERLTNKVINTKSSWFSPVRILDVIAQYSDCTATDVQKNADLKELVTQTIYGVTPHHINNNFDDVIKGDYSEAYRYTLGIKRFFEPLSDKTKAMFENGNQFIQSVDKNTNELWKNFNEIANEKGKHFEALCEWLGKTPCEFITDAAKQKGIYQGWLKKVGISFAVLTGITWLALSQFGKTNKLNPDVYHYKNESSGGN